MVLASGIKPFQGICGLTLWRSRKVCMKWNGLTRTLNTLSKVRIHVMSEFITMEHVIRISTL